MCCLLFFNMGAFRSLLILYRGGNKSVFSGDILEILPKSGYTDPMSRSDRADSVKKECYRKGGWNMFGIGDKVVHPMHGAGVIDAIVTEKVNGSVQDYYVFKMPVGGLVLKIPTAATQTVGLRKIMDSGETQRLLAAIARMEVDMTNNWSQRYRENMQRLKSGDRYEVARVIKGLVCRDSVRSLSTGERKMLHTAKQILISEIVLATGQDYRSVEDRINAAMSGEMAG